MCLNWPKAESRNSAMLLLRLLQSVEGCYSMFKMDVLVFLFRCVFVELSCIVVQFHYTITYNLVSGVYVLFVCYVCVRACFKCIKGICVCPIVFIFLLVQYIFDW